MPSSRLAAVALLISSQALGGCSWVFMIRPPPVVAVPDYPVSCTNMRAAPIVDSLCTGYFGLETLILAGLNSCDGTRSACYSSAAINAAMLVSAGLATACAFSAHSGFSNAARCEAVKIDNALCITGQEEACRRLNPGWSPPLKLPVAPPPPPPSAPVPPGP